MTNVLLLVAEAVSVKFTAFLQGANNMAYITESQEIPGNDGSYLVVRFDDTEPSVPVMYRFAYYDVDSVNNWSTTPFQSVNVQRNTVCDLVQNWLDEEAQ